MDFFGHQDAARRNTRRIVVLFILAVVAIVVAVNLVAVAVWASMSGDTLLARNRSLLAQVPPPLYLWTTVVTLTLIAAGTVYRVLQLARGGSAVAELVGARRIARDTADEAERRLLNIVDEMSIASGLTVPQAWVMDGEDGINAFAAGYSPNEAVIAVTRGALDHLSRDELQGVIAHEFSHVLNGDMRLNIHLLGVLNGILLIGAVGLFAIRSAGRVRAGKDNAGVILAIFMIGLALAAIGYVGVFFARLIKAAVSRQREFLADASAVQFTRNPEGIGGALYKIGRLSGAIAERHAEDLSHMFFGQPVRMAISGLFDTHPPLDARIQRLLGTNTLLFVRKRDKAAQAPEAEMPQEAETGIAAAAAGIAAAVPAAAISGVSWERSQAQGITVSPEAVLASVGAPDRRHAGYARELLAALPAEVRRELNSSEGAKAALCALLLGEGEARVRQLASIEQALGAEGARAAGDAADRLRPLGAPARLPVIDLAMPSLIDLPPTERERLLALLKALVEADRRVSIAEFVLLTLARRHLAHRPAGAPPVKHRRIGPLAAQCATVLSMLALAAKAPPEPYARAMASLGFAGAEQPGTVQLSAASVEAALYEVKLLAPLAKPALIKACLEIVMYDGKVSIAEAELMRAIAAAIDAPLPPILEQPPKE